MKKLLLNFIAFICLFLLVAYIIVRIPTIHDGKLLGSLPIPSVLKPESLPNEAVNLPSFYTWAGEDISKHYKTLPKLLKRSNTTAFLVIKDGKILYEEYANGVNKHDITQVFSVTKIFVTAILGIAIQEGYIQSLEQSVSDFIPEYKSKQYKNLKISHLLQMQSGLDYDEYGKLLQTLRFYYQKNLKKIIKNPKLKHRPGTVFTYKSIDTQILGECIERAVGKPFLEYFYEKIWSKIGAEDAAAWSIDSKLAHTPKYFGGLNISAADLAKFGIVVSQNGKNENGEIIIPSPWLNSCDNESYRVGEEDNKYCNGWWYFMDTPKENIYIAAGFNGQIMLINETNNSIIIRLGKNKGGIVWYPIMRELSRQL